MLCFLSGFLADSGKTLRSLGLPDADEQHAEVEHKLARWAPHSRELQESAEQREAEPSPAIEVYDEGDHIIVENEEGDVVAVEASEGHRQEHHLEDLKQKLKKEGGPSQWTYEGLKKRLGHWRDEEVQKRKEKQMTERKHEPACAYQFGNTIIVEDEDGGGGGCGAATGPRPSSPGAAARGTALTKRRWISAPPSSIPKRCSTITSTSVSRTSHGSFSIRNPAPAATNGAPPKTVPSPRKSAIP